VSRQIRKGAKALTSNPSLPVFQALEDVRHLESFTCCTKLAITLQPTDYKRSFCFCKECSGVGEVLDNPEGGSTSDNRR